MDLIGTLILAASIPAILCIIRIEWHRSADRRERFFFATALTLLFLSMFFGDDRIFDTWFKHGLFYASQIFFLLFLNRFSDEESLPPAAMPPIPAVLSAGAIPYAYSTSTPSFLSFLTEQGLSHFLTLPMFFYLFVQVRIKSIYTDSADVKRFLRHMFYAMASFMLIHFLEFFIESKRLLPALSGEPMEYIEMSFYLLGIALLWFGFRSLKRGDARGYAQ